MKWLMYKKKYNQKNDFKLKLQNNLNYCFVISERLSRLPSFLNSDHEPINVRQPLKTWKHWIFVSSVVNIYDLILANERLTYGLPCRHLSRFLFLTVQLSNALKCLNNKFLHWSEWNLLCDLYLEFGLR